MALMDTNENGYVTREELWAERLKAQGYKEALYQIRFMLYATPGAVISSRRIGEIVDKALEEGNE